MDKKTMLKVVLVMAVAMALALLIRGILLHSKDKSPKPVTVEELSFTETELDSKPYSGAIVVIDAGHGGKDPGKVGANGTLEKDINLEIALLLKELLEEDGVTVVMTRQTDTGLYDENSSNKKMQDLKGRLALIEESRADLVVSIHQNSFSDASVCGPQVFYYEGSVQGESAATLVQSALNTELEITRPRMQKSNDNYFLLTRCSKIMIIAECGFLSNPTEEKMLNDKAYRQRLAEALRKGIYEYLDTVTEPKEGGQTDPEEPII